MPPSWRVGRGFRCNILNSNEEEEEEEEEERRVGIANLIMDEDKSKKTWTKRRDFFFSSSTPSSTSSKQHNNAILAYSPRYLLSRWLRASSENGGEEDDGGLGCRMRIPRHPGRRKKESEEEAVRAAENLAEKREERKEATCSSSEHKPENFTLNQGIGVGLVFLLVRSATEFNKMIELRKQMELLLRDIKDEIQKKDAICAYAESTSMAFSASNCSGNGYASKHMHQKITDAFAAEKQVAAEVASFKNNDGSKMDVLEAELELELRRLHFNLESDDSSEHPPQQQQMELDDESTNASRSLDEGEDELNAEQNSGVCPLELERRLHELLEAQQQERIAELESALLRADKQLKEKEIEIAWWRDTAKLASQRAAGGTLHQLCFDE